MPGSVETAYRFGSGNRRHVASIAYPHTCAPDTIRTCDFSLRGAIVVLRSQYEPKLSPARGSGTPSGTCGAQPARFLALSPAKPDVATGNGEKGIRPWQESRTPTVPRLTCSPICPRFPREPTYRARVRSETMAGDLWEAAVNHPPRLGYVDREPSPGR
jgi:hypothetical protein